MTLAIVMVLSVISSTSLKSNFFCCFNGISCADKINGTNSNSRTSFFSNKIYPK